MATYELPLTTPSPSRPVRAGAGSLPENLLIRNALWFCRLRWLVVVSLAVFGVLALVPGAIGWANLKGHSTWPLAAAAVLGVTNLGFLWHARRLVRRGSTHGARSNLWSQITSDLAILSVVVHFAGSVETYVPFVYLFHIVLACIFFSRRESLLVAGLACVLYTACVLLEQAGVVPTGGIYIDKAFRQHLDQTPGLLALHVGSALATWLVVWYLASHLAAMVRARDSELAETNRRLVRMQEERMHHVLRTTHELKAPFAAIHANTQLLLKGYCGDLPQEAAETVRRIDARSNLLAREIQEMLQLANLRSSADKPAPRAELDLASVLGWCTSQLRATAGERGISVEADLEPAKVTAIEDHLKMLFTNVLSNAITYSHRGGQVRIRCRPLPPRGPLVTVEDDGIGIAPEKLPRIFEEHYRTTEAVKHNGGSSGLGLAIVRHVAQSHGIRIRVISRPGAGTRFELFFPPCGDLQANPTKEEAQDGLSYAGG